MRKIKLKFKLSDVIGVLFLFGFFLFFGLLGYFHQRSLTVDTKEGKVKYIELCNDCKSHVELVTYNK
jgi:uncharacterized membrane protein YciS (DUF1049 family)